jgi:hypothetical protein
MKHYFSIIAILFLVSCNIEKPIKRIVYDSVHKVNFIFEYDPSPPLSASEDRVYVKTAKGQELIFEGYNAPKIELKSFKKGVVIVEYCGGSIRKAASFLSNPDATGKTVVVRVQPVIIANVLIEGNRVCAE